MPNVAESPGGPPLTLPEYIALLALRRLGGESHAGAVADEILRAAGLDLTPGGVYTTLQRLELRGVLSSRTSAPTPVRGGRSRRLFVIDGRTRGAMAVTERVLAAFGPPPT